MAKVHMAYDGRLEMVRTACGLYVAVNVTDAAAKVTCKRCLAALRKDGE